MPTKEYMRKYRLENPDVIRKSSRVYYLKNRERLMMLSKKNNILRRVAIKENSKVKAIALKKEMVKAYGGECSCCAESHYEFLTIEHLNHDGAQDRNMFGTGPTFYRHLKKEGWPKDGLTILCMNCNWFTRYGDVCPHKQVRSEEKS